MSEKNNFVNGNTYQQLINNLPAGFALHEMIYNDKGEPVDYRFLAVNTSFEKLTGLKADDIIGKTCLELLPGTELIWIQRYGKVAMSGGTDHFENYSSELNKHYEVTAFQTAPNQFACVFHDVTKHVELSEHLKESEEKYRSLVEGSVQGMVVAQSNPTRISFASSPMERISGYSPEEITSFTPVEIVALIHEEDRGDFFGNFESRLSGGDVDPNKKYRLIHKNGDVVWVEVFSTVIKYNGEPAVQAAFIDITDRERAEESLRMILDRSPFPNAVVDKNDKEIRFWSKSAVALFGHKPETTEEWYKLAYPDPEYRRKIIDHWKAVLEKIQGTEEAVNTGEYHISCEDGTVKTCELFAQFIPDNLIVTFNDITERKISEKLIRENEAKFRSYVDNAPDGIFVADERGNYIDVNKSAERITGYNKEELLSMSIPDIIAPDYIEIGLEHFKKIGTSINSTLEAKYVHKNGENRWWSVDAIKVSENRFLGFVKDITERKNISENIIKNQKRYEKAQEMGHVGNWEYNPQTTMFWASNEAKRIYGFDVGLEDFTTEKVENCIPERESVHQALIDLVEHNKPYDLVFDIITHDKGVRKTIHSIAEVERDDQGNPLKVTGVISDITEKRKLETYLRRSQKLESLGLLAGGIAHDFNNILSAIMGFTEIAAMKTSEKEISEYLKKSLTSIERAQALTRQLLTFAKGGEPVKKIGKLFPFVEDTVNFALSGSSVSSKFNIQENLWPCDFDKNQIGQVIDNLTINAKQAMSDGGTIEVAAENLTIIENAHPVLDPGKYIKISLKDQGVGIPKEYLTKIFDPYYSTKPKGHGLGLATCYSIVQKHDGYIEVESEPGKGSTFSIFLPATDKPVDIENTIQISQHKGSGTFIVMDDEESIRDIVKEMLESFGYAVVLKQSGSETIDYLKEKAEENFDITGMIFDLTIPGGMGGKEAVKEVKKLFPDVPIFVASGYSEDPIVSNPENYGFNASIRKPFKLSDLSEMLEKHMKKS